MRTNKQIASAMKVTQALVFSALALGASARKAALRLCELRYVYLFHGEYRFSSMFFRAWLLRRDY